VGRKINCKIISQSVLNFKAQKLGNGGGVDLISGRKTRSGVPDFRLKNWTQETGFHQEKPGLEGRISEKKKPGRGK
jgi:hypothetical protein